MKNIENLNIIFSNMRGIFSIRFFFILLLSASTASCDGFVEVDLPDSQLTSEAVFADASSAGAALAGLYAKLRSTGMLNGSSTGISCYLGLYTDELDYYQQTAVSNFYNNSLFATDYQVNALWNQS